MAKRKPPQYRSRIGHSVLVALFALVTPFVELAPLANAANPITLQVRAFHGLPGLHHSALSRFLAAHMADAGLADWRFEPKNSDASARDRVEWTFILNPY